MSESKEDAAVLTSRHIRFGWFALLLFATLGIILETMHGFKIDWYLDVGNETRRLMWRLAHAHGGLLAIVNIAFALTLKAVFPPMVLPSTRAASRLLIAAAVLLPLGFFIGGVAVHGGDPSIGILLVPVGAACFIAAVALTAFAATRNTR